MFPDWYCVCKVFQRSLQFNQLNGYLVYLQNQQNFSCKLNLNRIHFLLQCIVQCRGITVKTQEPLTEDQESEMQLTEEFLLEFFFFFFTQQISALILTRSLCCGMHCFSLVKEVSLSWGSRCQIQILLAKAEICSCTHLKSWVSLL